MINQEVVSNRILNKTDLQKRLNIWRIQCHKIVFTNGCFDLIHAGHIHLLTKAADLGDKLVVGLNSDESVKKLKGEERPINNELTRSQVLASFSYVSAVNVFSEETPYELIKLIAPDILVKGGDYKEEDIVGADIVKQNGGEIITINLLDGYSTSSLEEKIKLQKQLS